MKINSFFKLTNTNCSLLFHKAMAQKNGPDLKNTTHELANKTPELLNFLMLTTFKGSQFQRTMR